MERRRLREAPDVSGGCRGHRLRQSGAVECRQAARRESRHRVERRIGAEHAGVPCSVGEEEARAVAVGGVQSHRLGCRDLAIAAVVQTVALAPAGRFVDTVGRRPALIGGFAVAALAMPGMLWCSAIQ